MEFLEEMTRSLSKFLYKQAYYLGVQLRRKNRRFLRRMRPAAYKAHRASVKFTSVCRENAVNAFSSVKRSGTSLSRFLSEIRQNDFKTNLKYAVRTVPKSMNYVMPVVALAAFFTVYNSFTDKTLALSVVYDGNNIGYIADEGVFNDAQQAVSERIIYEEYEKPIDFLPEYSLCLIDKTDLSDSDELADRIINASDNKIEMSSGLYIDGSFMGAVTDSEALIKVLDQKLEPFKKENPNAEVAFTNKIEIKNGLYPVSSVVDTSNIQNEMNQSVETEQTYTVQPNDTPLLIASRNGIEYSELKALNPDIEDELLIGQEVLIQKATPKLSVSVVDTIQYSEEIPYESTTVETDKELNTYKEVTTEGKNGEKQITAKVTYINGVETERTVLDTTVLSEPVDEVITKGTREPVISYPSYSGSGSSSSSSSAGGGFIWPVAGGYVSCGIWGYSGHTGMDIAAPQNTPIYASKSGRVVLAVNSGPYGKHIIIDHGNGVTTLYAHCNALAVSAGQYVSQGEVIGYVGTTGNSSGNHCHFEIRVNGSYMNPANYIGTR